MLDSTAPAALVSASSEGDQPLFVRQPVGRWDPEEALNGQAQVRLGAPLAVKPLVNAIRTHPHSLSNSVPGESERAEGAAASRARRGALRHGAQGTSYDVHVKRRCDAGENLRHLPNNGASLELMEWWERLRQAAKKQGITQEVLAAKLGQRQGAVSNILSGKRPAASIVTVKAFADALGLDLEWVMGTNAGPKVSDEPVDVFATGERRFREWVADKEPQHLAKVPDFLRRLAAERRQRWPAQVLATDVEEGLINEFRAYRRGEWDRDEPAGVPYVPAKRGAR